MRTAYSNVPRRSLYYVLVCTSATLLHVAAENTARDVWFSDRLRTRCELRIVSVSSYVTNNRRPTMMLSQRIKCSWGRRAGRQAGERAPVDLAGVAGGDMIRARAMSCWRRRVCSSSSSSSSGGGGGAYHSTTACISIARRDELTTHPRQFQPSLNSSVCKNEIKFY